MRASEEDASSSPSEPVERPSEIRSGGKHIKSLRRDFGDSDSAGLDQEKQQQHVRAHDIDGVLQQQFKNTKLEDLFGIVTFRFQNSGSTFSPHIHQKLGDGYQPLVPGCHIPAFHHMHLVHVLPGSFLRLSLTGRTWAFYSTFCPDVHITLITCKYKHCDV